MLGKIFVYDPEEDRKPEAKPSPDRHIPYEQWRPKHDALTNLPGWLNALSKVQSSEWSRYDGYGA